MSRTYRNKSQSPIFFRKPKTFNEIKQIKGILTDINTEDIPYKVDKVNRMHRFIPTEYDDISCSAWEQQYKREWSINHYEYYFDDLIPYEYDDL